MFEDKFKKKHQPIEKNILILCRKCHKVYDAQQSIPESQGIKIESRKQGGVLPITLDPKDPVVFKSNLLTRRSANIIVTYKNGRTETRQWHASKFSQHSNVLGNLRSRAEFRPGQWQKNNISSVHVRVI